MIIHDAAITGSLSLNGVDLSSITGSSGGSNFATTGSNIFIGNQTITGSVGITGSLSVNDIIIINGNNDVLIGTTTSAGYKLDVNGTTRFNGLSTIQGTTASDTAPLGSELAAVTGTGANWTLAGTNLNVGGYTHTAGATTPLTTTLAAVNGTYYRMFYTITGRTAGSLVISFGDFTTTSITSTGITGPVASSTAPLVIVPTTDFNGTVVLSIRTIGTSSASVSYLSSAGTVTNELRISSTNSNTFLGRNAGSRNVGSGNTAFGSGALTTNTTGTQNTAIGNNSLSSNSSGILNTAVGQLSLLRNTSGNQNIGIGWGALEFNTTGSFNVAVGNLALNRNTTGVSNTAIGYSALFANTIGNNNTVVGDSALRGNTIGPNNVALGFNAGRYAGSGTTAMASTSGSMYLGYQTRGLNAGGSINEIVIGYDVVGLGSNTTVLGNSSTVTTALYGNVGIGTTSPAYKITCRWFFTRRHCCVY
jgi:trimeric autotransporter adhesin